MNILFMRRRFLLKIEILQKCFSFEKKKKSRVRLYRTGCQRTPIHRCGPTTARHGNFCLLDFSPGPFRPSLHNLDILDSSKMPILMPSLVRTPDRHGAHESRTPDLKPFSDSSFQVAGLQEHATTPSDDIGENKLYKLIKKENRLIWYQNLYFFFNFKFFNVEIFLNDIKT